MISKRTIYFLLLPIILGAGLFSRTEMIDSTSIYGTYGGDTLWTVMVYFVLRLLFPNFSPAQTCIASIAYSFLTELSQMLKYDFLLQLRSTRLGALILGHGFLWSDLACYLLGAMIAFGVDLILMKSNLLLNQDSEISVEHH